jgi:hypothetical protein
MWRSHRADNRVRSVKNHIQHNLLGSRFDRYQYFNLSNYKGIKRNFQNFGASVGEAIRNDDIDAIIELANDSVRVRFDWIDFISDHFHTDVFRCYDCECIEHDDNRTTCYDDYSVCSNCADDYVYDDERDTYVREEDLSCNRIIGDYHSSRGQLGHIPSLYDDRKPRVLLGLELELEIDGDIENRAEQLLNGVGKYGDYQYALCEHDGSLDHGFEMVTAYTGLDVHQKQLRFFEDKTLRGAKSHDTSTCGLHVHICKADMTTLHGAKMILFINDQANQKLIRSIARRDSTYGAIKNKKDEKDWLSTALDHEQKKYQLMSLNADRYEALNFKNPKTVEFRLFKGSLKYGTIMACLEFTYATWFFCRDASTKNLTIEHFLKFICADQNRKDTKFLRSFLKHKGFTLPQSNVHLFKKVA